VRSVGLYFELTYKKKESTISNETLVTAPYDFIVIADGVHSAVLSFNPQLISFTHHTKFPSFRPSVKNRVVISSVFVDNFQFCKIVQPAPTIRYVPYSGRWNAIIPRPSSYSAGYAVEMWYV
jgi:hypothetical protein